VNPIKKEKRMHRHLGLIVVVMLGAAFAQAAEPPSSTPPTVRPAAPAPEQAQALQRFLGALAPAAQQAPQPPRTITVTGRAVGYIPKDTVIWTISLESTGKDVPAVKQAADLRLKAVTDICQAKGIQADDIDPGLIHLVDTRITDSAAADPQKPILATRNVTVRQRDAAKFNDLLDVLSRDKTNRVKFVFVCSKRDEVMRETVTQASQAAREKAAAMATVAGAKVGRPLTIDEYPPAKMNVPEASVPVDHDTPAFGVDCEKVIMTVYVTFELE
jgi:uncharacterized protein YggE